MNEIWAGSTDHDAQFVHALDDLGVHFPFQKKFVTAADADHRWCGSSSQQQMQITGGAGSSSQQQMQITGGAGSATPQRSANTAAADECSAAGVNGDGQRNVRDVLSIRAVRPKQW